jgi:hypothetical protein
MWRRIKGEGIVRRLIAMVAGLTVIATATIAQAAIPEVVLDEPGVRETYSSASDGYLVWSANSEARPSSSHSYVMEDGESPVRIDPPGVQSFSAGIDGTTIVYQEWSPLDSDLWSYDAVTAERSALPDGVNTPSGEFRPTISNEWLLFTRTNTNRPAARRYWVKVVLFDLISETHTVLERLSARGHYLVSNQVNGDWATYESCRFRRGRFFDCQVFRHQISTGTTVKVANPGLQQYAGAVSGDGTVYLTRTRTRDRWRCGNHAKLVRVPVGGPGVVIAELPDGRDALTTFALDESGGSTTMYFDRSTCRNDRGGIYRILDADSATL